jgi:uncharacterized protein YegJ (DUF2314 family)
MMELTNMAVHIEARDGSVRIIADEGSTVSNVRVQGKRVDVATGDPDWIVVNRPAFWDRPVGRGLAYGLMLAFCAFVWSCIFAACSRVAHCDDCSTLSSPDERHLCRATTQCLKSECEFIEKPDTRQACRIRVKESCK